ncbi:prolyl oligopeptidase family serine peptidase [Luteibacter yeojuensis]|uniref:prolyl oligopeptidase n=1 Tax=Luteibacter yeojuensis TaxID=345309 RepID=A0A7X5TPR7_9GAMM|nr:prolyl oligopeptidase family serine peptidase [Luteibacter yeojuensis]NID14717.1 prolyl oligopeptidase family serine peptidase [Luteibacter yeojuensis]
MRLLPWRFAGFVLIASAAGASIAAAAPQTAPPPPRSADVTEQLFGVTVHDPYRWMEGEKNAEFERWLGAEGEYTRAKLDALPTLDDWQKTLKASSLTAVIHRMQRVAGGRMLFIRQAAKGTGTLMLREADGKERVLLDPSTWKGGGGTPSVTNYALSPDGSKVAVNIDHGGNELTRVDVLDVATGKPSGDSVETVWGEFEAHWLPDGSGFTYTQMAPPGERTGGDPLQDMRLRLHKLGTPSSHDPMLLRAGSGAGANASFPIPSNRFPVIDFPAGSRWALGIANGAQLESTFCVAPAAKAIEPSAKWNCIARPDDKITDAAIHGDTLYLISSRGHSNGQLLSLDLSRSDVSLRDAKPVLALKDDEIIVGLTLNDAQTLAPARDALYLKVSVNGIDGVRRIDYRTGKSETVAMPVAGTASLLRANDREEGFLLELRGWTAPPKSWRYDPATHGMKSLGQDEASPADYSMVEVTETEMVSKDGTKVPLTILHRRDAKLDGSHRAIVFGYGSYGLTIQPSFKPVRMEWVKKGNIFAYAHVRGGGEKGEAWHLAGKGANKHKGVEDFVASVDRLSELGYSRPERTALVSGSAGGLLVGGAVTAYPQKFGAAIILVPVLNPVRLMHAPNGANQIGEMGDPRKAADFPAILAMDPYQQIKPHTAYPAMLFLVGLNDGRVVPWQTGKFVAKLRAADTSGRPAWIRTDANGGHGIQSSLGAEAAQWADIFAFLDAELPAPTHR